MVRVARTSLAILCVAVVLPTLRIPVVVAATGGPDGVAPVLLSPPSGGTLAEGEALAWIPDPLGVEASVEISTSPTFAIGTDHGQGTTRSSLIPANLSPGVVYYWRVYELEVTNHFGPTSVVRSFKYTGADLSRTSLVSPVGGATFAYPDSDLVLRWTPVARATGYEVEFASDAAFTVNEYRERSGVPELATPLRQTLVGAPVHWRVRPLRGEDLSEDRTRQVGPWSWPATYTLTWNSVPSPTAPLTGSTVTSLVAEWAPIEGAGGYDVEWTAASDPTFALAQTLQSQLPYRFLPAPSGAAAIWRVRAYVDGTPAGAVTAWSPTATVTVDASGDPPGAVTPPVLSAPTLGGPEDGTTVVSTSEVALRWDAVPEAVGYQVQWARSVIDFDLVNPEISTPNIVLPLGVVGESGESYHWRVRAIRGDPNTGLAAGPWSETRVLHVATATPVTLDGPADGADVPISVLELRWSGAERGSARLLQLSRTPDFASPLNHGPLLVDAERPALQEGTWYWRVWSMGYPANAVSETRSFTVIDDDAPVGHVPYGLPFIPEGVTELGLSADVRDRTGHMDAELVSLDGTTWTGYPADNDSIISIALPIESDAPGWSGPGRRDVWIKWRDESGNESAPVQVTYWYAVDPPGTPGAPTNVTAVAGDRQATVSWAEPTDTGGGAITAYRVDVLPSGAGCSTTGATSCTVHGLTNGTSYTFTVRAANAAAMGAASAPSNAIKPHGATATATMAALASVQATTRFQVGWSATAGSAPVTNYDVRRRSARSGGSFGSYATWLSGTTATRATVSSARGTTWCFSVRAHDADGGVSPWSAERCTSVPLGSGLRTPLRTATLVRSVSRTP